MMPVTVDSQASSWCHPACPGPSSSSKLLLVPRPRHVIVLRCVIACAQPVTRAHAVANTINFEVHLSLLTFVLHLFHNGLWSR
eukprot:3739919-Rhodomonas_salina.1